MKPFILLSYLLTLLLFFANTLQAQFRLDVESGAVFYGYNRIQVPGDAGTRFALDDRYTSSNRFFYRIKALYTLNDKHTFAALYAPLIIRSLGIREADLDFAGRRFGAGEALDVLYQFNSYRLTYRYLFPRTGDFRFGVGVTAKIRDAKILLTSQNLAAEKVNIGFVPLINFRIEWLMKEKLSLLLQGDALVSRQGRAEDVLLAFMFYPSRKVTLKAGYRILEGGANNDEVYNFSLIHYALIGGIIRF